MTTTRAAALYIGALLGPSLLIVPGLAAALAGPASLLDWVALLALSGLFAWVFTALGRRFRDGDVATYARAGLGDAAARVASWAFLAGVVLGAPVVCLAGGAYVAPVLGLPVVAVAAGLLVSVVAVTLAGLRTSAGVQLALVVVLVGLVLVAVAGSAGRARAANWTPFLPHGAGSLGHAATVLMLSFVGWEAIAPMVGRLRDPQRQLPRVVTIAFAVTAVVDLALAAATVAVLGAGAAGTAPVAALLRVAVGPAGGVLAAAVAALLVLGGVNAYVSGAAELAAHLRPAGRHSVVQLWVAVSGGAVLGAVGAGWVSVPDLVAVPTSLFVTVYVLCTASAARLLRGPVRAAAAVACVASVTVLAFAGWALLVVAAVGVAAALAGSRRPAAPVRETCCA